MTRELFNNFFPENVLAFTTTRDIDFSFEEGLNDLSENQKEALSARLKFKVPKIANIHQVYGDRVITVSPDDFNHGRPIAKPGVGIRWQEQHGGFNTLYCAC